MLTLESVSAGYGRVEALRGVSLGVSRGELVCLLGANGAGKTTTLKTISGLVQARSGRIVFDGEEIHGLDAPEIVRRGIAHCPEGRRVFPFLMVEQNAYGALRMADRAYVMEAGRITLDGAARDLLHDAHVKQAYLGG